MCLLIEILELSQYRHIECLHNLVILRTVPLERERPEASRGEAGDALQEVDSLAPVAEVEIFDA